jgi:hypothetical protein
VNANSVSAVQEATLAPLFAPRGIAVVAAATAALLADARARCRSGPRPAAPLAAGMVLGAGPYDENDAKDVLTRLGIAARYLVEAMAPPGVDLVVGGRRDAVFGPVVLLGLGGTTAARHHRRARRTRRRDH